MIPKIIHLCWLSGDPYPQIIEKCISTWKKHLPDYEIIIWDTNRFDINSLPWTKEAFEARKYAFAADYIRFYAVYNFGGIYLDSDVEVMKSFDSLLDKPYFVGEECLGTHLEVAVFGAEKGTWWIKDALDYYDGRHFIKEDGTYDLLISPKIMDKLLRNRYEWVKVETPERIVHDETKLYILPNDWLCGREWLDGGKGKIVYKVTDNTIAIHHFAHTWAEFPGGMLHKIYYKVTGKDWYKHYFGNFTLIQDVKTL